MINAVEHEQGIFKVRLEVGLLRGLVFGLSTLVDECAIDCCKKGLETKVVDPAHVAMMEIYIPKGVLQDYKCIKPGRVGIDLDKLARELVNMSNREIVTLEIIEGTSKDSGKPLYLLKLQYGNYYRKMKCIDTTGMSEPKVPAMNLSASFVTTFRRIQNIVSRLDNISDHIKVSWHPEGVQFSGYEYDDETGCFKYPKDLLDGLEHLAESPSWKGIEDNKREEYHSLFPLDYFGYPFRRSGKQGLRHWFNKEEWLNIITFTMGNDYPMIMESERDGLKWRFLLAPRIESE